MLSCDELHLLKNTVYTNFSEALKESEKRKNDVELHNKLSSMFGENIFSPLANQPKAVLCRSIITPNLEYRYFVDLVKNTNLDPQFLEYDGKFVAKNAEKYHLCKLYFFEQKSKKNTLVTDSLRIVDFNSNEGRLMSDINTTWGENLKEMHHNLLKFVDPDSYTKVFDFTEWFNKTRYSSDYYYFYYFSLFTTGSILFENFLTEDKEEGLYIKNHVLNSFKAVTDYFGVKPLIVPLLPFENEKYTSWYSYPTEYKQMLKNVTANKESYVL